MASSAANEKKQDERRIKELRDFQRSNSANKRCFDCNEMMPQYVCLDFNTFICTQCSGIHREFAHRIKSISMSKFTDIEVKNMIKFGGNETAQKYWRARHDVNFRPSGTNDGERIRNFIRLTYIDRKWVYESPRESKRSRDEPQSSSKKNSFGSGDNDFFGSSSYNTSNFDAFGSNDSSNSGGFGDFADFSSGGSSNKNQSSDFGDFGNFGGSSSGNRGAGGSFEDFGDFGDQKQAARTNSRTSSASKEYLSGSFKLAPPPGSNFSSSTTPSSSTTTKDFFGDSSSSSQPVATAAPATHDFLAFSPDKNVGDPFGFSSGSAKNTPTASGQRPNSSSFDAFGEVTGSRGSSSSFDAFGASLSTSSAAAPASPFDAFGSVSTPSASAGGRPSASSFDAFGVGNATNFGDFSNAPVTPPVVANSADPFGTFSPRGSASAVPAASDPPKQSLSMPAAPVDPFSAFDSMDSNDILSSSSTTNHQASSNISTTNADPFAFADSSSSSTSASANSSASAFGNAYGASSTNAPSNQTGMGGFQGFGGPSHPTRGMPGGGMGAMGQMFNNNNVMFQQPHQQQNMFGTPHQQMLGQNTTGATPGFPPMNIPHATALGQSIPQPQADATASIKDPFASLNIGITSTSSKPASTSSSQSSIPPFSTPQINTASPSQTFGVFQAAPPANISRGNSFDMSGGFSAPTPAQSSSSPLGFAPPPAPHQSAKSVMDPFSDFGSFDSATTNKTISSSSLVTSQPAAAASASANPFDMF